MSSYITFGEKYGSEATNQSFWVKTFKNAFTYSYKGDKLRLMVWDGELGQFGEVSEDYKTENVKYLNCGIKCFRITLDNNLKLTNENFKPYNVSGFDSKMYNYSNPMVIRIGSDNYLVYEMNVSGTKNYKDKIYDAVLRCCVSMFGDAVNITQGQYYWNFDEDIVDTFYERYTELESMSIKNSKRFEILYEPHGCRVDKYKEEDSSYVVDRYF